MGLRRTLNRSLLLPIGVIALLAALTVSIFSWFSVNRQYQMRLQDLSEGSAVLFEDLLWQLDNETVQVLLEEYVQLGVVQHAQVRVVNGPELSAGSPVSSGQALVTTSELRRVSTDVDQALGSLTLSMSREGVWAEVKRRTLATLLVALVAALVTTWFIQRLLNARIVEPTLRLADTLSSWQGDWREFHIDLERNRPHGPDARDELDQLVDAIHTMRDHILSTERSLMTRDEKLIGAARLAGIGYMRFDLDSGRVEECDEYFAGMIGLDAEQMIGFSMREDIIRDRVHVDDVEKAIQVGKQLARGQAAESLLRIADADGGYRWVRQLYDLSSTDDGRRHVRTVAQDVSELIGLQSTLLHAQKVKAIGNLTGGVAHDFNNILAVISGNLELLEISLNNPELQKHVDTSLHAVQLGADLTHQLLAFARKQPLRPEITDVGRLLRKLRSLLKTTVGETVDLEVVTDAGLWQIDVDRAQLEAAILNMVINARDAMPGGGKLTIEAGNTRLDESYARRHEEVVPGRYVCIAITDTGCGMNSETIERALEPFFTTKGVGEGVGLGLPMAFGFAKQSGGHLKVYSEVDRGTSVKLYLPQSRPDTHVHTTSSQMRSITQFDGLRVLLVEDNEELRLTYTQQLQRLGSVVHGAVEGKSALSQLKQLREVDLILCDVVLPGGMSGPEVVSQLRQRCPTAAVIYMSGYTENAIIHQGRLDDDVVLLQKPFTMDKLVSAYAEARDMLDQQLSAGDKRGE